MFSEFKNSSKKIHFGNLIYILSSKQFNLGIFQITEKKNKLKTTIFWRTFDMINWRFIKCRCKRTPLLSFKNGYFSTISGHFFTRFQKNRRKTHSLKTYILPRLYQYALPLLGILNFLPAWVLQRAREPPNPGRTLRQVCSNLELEPKPNCFQSETNCEKENLKSDKHS